MSKLNNIENNINDDQKSLLKNSDVPNQLKNWMTNISKELQDIPIWKLTIPGSHDSGTYGLEISSGISPDRPDLQNSNFIRLLSCISYPAIHRWTKTQTLNLSQQLLAGIRYIDFRVATKPSNDDLYFCHGLYGPKINEMINDINEFLIENTREVVFLDFQHFYGLSDEDHKQLISKLSQTFGRRLVPYQSILKMDSITLNSLWDKKQQVFVYYRDETARMENPNLWPSRCLPNPWANTMSCETLINFLNQNTSQRPPNSVYVSQGILTPSNNYVASHLFTTLKKDLVEKCNTVLLDWIQGQTAGPKGPNILMTDFIEWNNYAFPVKTVELNNSIKNIKKN